MQKVKYKVFAGGLRALEIDLTNDLANKNEYNILMRAKTFGMLGKLAPWSGSFETSGWKGETFMPEQHQSIATWRGEVETKTYSYNKDGSFLGYKIVEEGVDKSPEEVAAELTQGTTDILTATMNAGRNISAGQSCESSTEIFDGKRRFRLNFKEVEKVELESSKHNAYNGPAIKCEALVEPVAGKWHKKPRGWASIQEQGMQQGSLPTVWFASVEEGKPAIPVKVRVKTDYGTLFMHMIEYEGTEKTLASAK